jgi:2'-hydroxyisoflavone reductase
VRILILGGTVFLGRHLSQLALERGHDVTLFNRGIHGADLFPDAKRLIGDRAADLSALERGTWDVVLDTCGFIPQDVRATAELLRDRVTRYVFVSSESVYRDWPACGVNETARIHRGTDPANYGALKARCEEALEAEMPERALHVRSGLLVGPYEKSVDFLIG